MIHQANFYMNFIISGRGVFHTGLNDWTAENICESGYEICPSAYRAGKLGLTAAICGSISNNDEFYASKQSSEGNAICSSTGTDDIWGCARDDVTNTNILTLMGDADSRWGCNDTFVAFMSSISPKPQYWSFGSSTDELNTADHSGSYGGGVLCCRQELASTPTNSPSEQPTPTPTNIPTIEPTVEPTPTPSIPTHSPTVEPTLEPTPAPTAQVQHRQRCFSETATF